MSSPAKKSKSRPTLKSVVKCIVWGKAAGRCQYTSCNKPLWKDSFTNVEFNNSYLAHIVAAEPDGPRGEPILSPQLADDPANIILLCDSHHRLIDKVDVAGHPVERLQQMKQDHELRIEMQTELTEAHQSEIISYQANIGPHLVPLHLRECADALRPHRYPASLTGIGLGWDNSIVRDGNPEFWAMESRQLRGQFAERIQPRLARIPHVSIFAIAPQPLLMLLGHLLSELPTVEVFQRARNPQTWRWPEKPEPQEFVVAEPTTGTIPALVFSLTNKVAHARVLAALPEAAIWEVSVKRPHQDCIQDRTQLATFRDLVRSLLDRIKNRHPRAKEIHVFPVMPVSVAVEVGRVIQAKAHLPMLIYDENRGFSPALRLPS
jgi:hypothetical protein